MIKTYAGIGSRKTPKDILIKMEQISKKLSELGYTLRSGGAIGADLAFERGSSKKEIFLSNDATKDAHDLTSKFHPAWGSLDSYTKGLHARNAMIILGRELNDPVEFGVCWTPNGKIMGGTGQALRIAEDKGVKIYNLFIEKDLKDLREFVSGLIQVSKSSVGPVKKEADLNLFDPSMDGISHINIYSKGKTQLGRFLTNFSKSPFICEDGVFDSVEGYWYWLGSSKDEKAEPLRRLTGFEAKKFGRNIGCSDWIEGEEFKRKIIDAITNKIATNIVMMEEFRKSKLPFVHYYNYKEKIVKVPKAEWIMEGLESIRKEMKVISLKGDVNSANFGKIGLVYEKGSLTDVPVESVIGHSCNSQGDWGAGVALHLKKLYPDAHLDQFNFCRNNDILGSYHIFSSSGVRVVSLFTSKGYGRNKSPSNEILEFTKTSIIKFFQETGVDHIYLPKINSGYFGVKWELTERILLEVLELFPGKRITIREI